MDRVTDRGLSGGHLLKINSITNLQHPSERTYDRTFDTIKNPIENISNELTLNVPGSLFL